MSVTAEARAYEDEPVAVAVVGGGGLGGTPSARREDAPSPLKVGDSYEALMRKMLKFDTVNGDEVGESKDGKGDESKDDEGGHVSGSPAVATSQSMPDGVQRFADQVAVTAVDDAVRRVVARRPGVIAEAEVEAGAGVAVLAETRMVAEAKGNEGSLEVKAEGKERGNFGHGGEPMVGEAEAEAKSDGDDVHGGWSCMHGSWEVLEEKKEEASDAHQHNHTREPVRTPLLLASTAGTRGANDDFIFFENMGATGASDGTPPLSPASSCCSGDFRDDGLDHGRDDFVATTPRQAHGGRGHTVDHSSARLSSPRAQEESWGAVSIDTSVTGLPGLHAPPGPGQQTGYQEKEGAREVRTPLGERDVNIV